MEVKERPKINDFGRLLLHLKIILPKFAPDISSREVLMAWFPPFERFSKGDYQCVLDYCRVHLTEFPSSPRVLLDAFNSALTHRDMTKPKVEPKLLGEAEVDLDSNARFMSGLRRALTERTVPLKRGRDIGS